MRRITTQMHGVADYVTSVALIAAPMLINEKRTRPEVIIPMALGAGTLVTSLMTDYELGAAKTIKMPVHLGIDIAGGLFLAASPWIFGFSKRTWVPHVAIGLMQVAIALTTDTQPYQDTYLDLDDDILIDDFEE
ncbi:MAG: SPW repeat domain-containing protein, partial [Bacteroidia bacterium]